MANVLTEARQQLAARLIPLGYRVYPTPVEAPAPPCYQIGAGTPWLTKRRLGGGQADLNLQIRVLVPQVGGNIESLELLEQMVWAVESVVHVAADTMPPRQETVNEIGVLVADLVVKATVKE